MPRYDARWGTNERVTELSVSADGRYLLIKIPVRYVMANADFTKAPIRTADLLTKREQDVFDLAVEGKCGKEMASELGVGLRCVKFHMHSILHKLGVQTQKDLMRLYRNKPVKELVPA